MASVRRYRPKRRTRARAVNREGSPLALRPRWREVTALRARAARPGNDAHRVATLKRRTTWTFNFCLPPACRRRTCGSRLHQGHHVLAPEPGRPEPLEAEFVQGIRDLRQRVGARRARAVGAVVVVRLQALEVEVQVAHWKVSDSAPVVEGDVWGRKAVRMAATSFGLADLAIPGKRPGHVLPLAGYTAVRGPRQRPRSRPWTPRMPSDLASELGERRASHGRGDRSTSGVACFEHADGIERRLDERLRRLEEAEAAKWSP